MPPSRSCFLTFRCVFFAWPPSNTLPDPARVWLRDPLRLFFNANPCRGCHAFADDLYYRTGLQLRPILFGVYLDLTGPSNEFVTLFSWHRSVHTRDLPFDSTPPFLLSPSEEGIGGSPDDLVLGCFLSCIPLKPRRMTLLF